MIWDVQIYRACISRKYIIDAHVLLIFKYIFSYTAFILKAGLEPAVGWMPHVCLQFDNIIMYIKTLLHFDEYILNSTFRMTTLYIYSTFTFLTLSTFSTFLLCGLLFLNTILEWSIFYLLYSTVLLKYNRVLLQPLVVLSTSTEVFLYYTTFLYLTIRCYIRNMSL